MKTRTSLLLFVFVLVAIVSCKQQSSYEEYTETLVTYPYSDTNAFPVIPNYSNILATLADKCNHQISSVHHLFSIV